MMLTNTVGVYPLNYRLHLYQPVLMVTRDSGQNFMNGFLFAHGHVPSKIMVLKRKKGLKRPQTALKHGKGLKARPDPLLKAWAAAVRQRDGSCQFPGCKYGSRALHSHHINPRSRRPDLKYVVANGVLLCSLHHKWVHDHPIKAGTLGLLGGESYEVK